MCAGTREQLSQELQRRGVIGAQISAGKDALRKMLRMAVDLEATEQELAVAQKRSPSAAASPATLLKPSKRAAAGGARPPCSDSADMSRECDAQSAGASMLCSACLNHV